MLDVEQKFKDLYNSYGGKKLKLMFYKDDYRALYPSETLFPSEQLYPSEMDSDAIDFVISDDMIQSDSMKIMESLSSNEDLSFGACECSQFEIIVSGLSKNIAGKEFLVSEQFGEYELVLGLFTVDSTPKQEDKDTRKIIAYDRMKRFDADVSGWYNLLSFPMTLRAFRNSLCEFVGVNEVENTELINDDMEVEKTLEPSSLNGRDVLKYICQINGTFGNITKNGELRYVSVPKKDDISVEITVYKTVESEEYNVPDIDTVKIQQEDGDIGGTSEGDGNNVYVIEGNPLAYGKNTSQMITIANNIKSVISSISYCPAEISTNGSPWIEVGDRIKVVTSDGVINTIVTKRDLTGIQGSMDYFSSTGSQELERKFNIESEIIQVKGLSAILKRTVEEVSNELTDLEQETISKFTQTAHEISLMVKKGDVTSQINSELKVTGNAIELTTGHFTINAKNMTVDSGGNATFSGTVSGASIVSSSINIGDGNFTVNLSGAVEANNAKITAATFNATGIIYAERGIVCNGEIEADIGSLEKINTQSIYCTGMVYGGGWTQISDRREKRDIQDIPTDTCIEVIKRLKPVAYTLIDNGIRGTGFIAQDVKEISDEMNLDYQLVSYFSEHRRYGIEYKNYIAFLTGAVQHILERLGE